jgi:hypothetical protein
MSEVARILDAVAHCEVYAVGELLALVYEELPRPWSRSGCSGGKKSLTSAGWAETTLCPAFPKRINGTGGSCGRTRRPC